MRWFQFRLRTLLLFVLLTAAGMGGYGYWLRLKDRWSGYRQQAARHAQLERHYLQQQKLHAGLMQDIGDVNASAEESMRLFAPGEVDNWRQAEDQFVRRIEGEVLAKRDAYARQALYHAQRRREFESRW